LGKIQQKRQLKLVKENSATAEAEYKRKCNEVKAAVRQDKNEWLDKQCHDIEKHHAEHRTRGLQASQSPQKKMATTNFSNQREEEKNINRQIRHHGKIDRVLQ